MPDSSPAQRANGHVVVAFPESIGESNASQVGEELLLPINRGATELIADMTSTVSCDHAGADAVLHAYLRAAASGTQLRLAVTVQAVRRVLTLNGLARLIPVYPSLEAAVTAAGPAAPAPAMPWPGDPHPAQSRKSDRAVAEGGRA